MIFESGDSFILHSLLASSFCPSVFNKTNAGPLYQRDTFDLGLPSSKSHCPPLVSQTRCWGLEGSAKRAAWGSRRLPLR